MGLQLRVPGSKGVGPGSGEAVAVGRERAGAWEAGRRERGPRSGLVGTEVGGSHLACGLLGRVWAILGWER